ncbi:MAG TPA: hypothetical protein VK743_12165 [Steroidobacteraceae bacterium]|jgi:hypothetical protein|nr:hypothetical protein [Steroidobacteraceae bacterium]
MDAGGNGPIIRVFPAENACFANWCALFGAGNARMRPHIETGTAAWCGPALQRNLGDFDMFATAARWSHNTLLLAMALLTAALVVFAI